MTSPTPSNPPRGSVWPKLLVAIVVAVLVMVAPSPTSADQVLAIKNALTGRGIAVTGFSVITHVSKCDRDTRTIPQMVGADAGTASADLSYPGQSLFEGFNFAQIATRNRRIRDTIVYVSVSQMENWGRPNIQVQGFFRLASGDYEFNRLGPRIAGLEPITEGEMVQQTAFRYRGTDYPAYAQLKAQYMVPEQLAAGCPEPPGQNPAFIAADYWNNYLHAPIHAPFWSDLVRLQAATQAAGKRFQLVVLPIDFEDIRALDPALATAIGDRRDTLLAQARQAGLSPLDLTELLPAGGYADRWCACGHLADTGRAAVAARSVAALEAQR